MREDFSVRQGRLGRRVLAAVRKAKPDAALRQNDRAGAGNVSVRGYNCLRGRIAALQGARNLDYPLGVSRFDTRIMYNERCRPSRRLYGGSSCAIVTSHS